MRNPSTRDDLAQQVFDQGRLAAARLAGDAHHQTAPGDGNAESFAQRRPLFLVADGAPAPARRDGQTEVIAAHTLRCRRLVLQPIQHSCDGGFRWRAKFLAHERLVGFAVAQRFGDFAALGQSRHQSECRPGAQRLERSEPAPPPLRCLVIPRSRGACGQLREHVAHLFRQPAPLKLDPTLEFRRFAEIEPVQESTGVEIGGFRQVARMHRVLKRLDVARDEGRVQSQLARAEEEAVCLEIVA